MFRQQFHNLLIEDLLPNIPTQTGKPAIEILGSRRESVIKWLYFEANSVYRRPVTHFGNIERRNGILIMIQALILAISTSTFKEEKKPDAPVSVKKDLSPQMQAVENFKKRRKLSTE